MRLPTHPPHPTPSFTVLLVISKSEYVRLGLVFAGSSRLYGVTPPRAPVGILLLARYTKYWRWICWERRRIIFLLKHTPNTYRLDNIIFVMPLCDDGTDDWGCGGGRWGGKEESKKPKNYLTHSVIIKIILANGRCIIKNNIPIRIRERKKNRFGGWTRTNRNVITIIYTVENNNNKNKLNCANGVLFKVSTGKLYY